MTNRHFDKHLSAESVQALLEGELPKEERAGVEEHLHVCPRCADEFSAWKTIFTALDDLPVLNPGQGFAERIMDVVAHPEPVSLAARARAALRVVAVSTEGRHPAPGRVHDFVEGLLPARQAAPIAEHLAACSGCTDEAATWRSVLERLQAVGHLHPSEGFAQRVMAAVRVPVAAPVRRKVPEWRRALAWAGGLVPQTRQAWAVLSGVAVTPAATLGLLLWTLFTHPTLTPGALASFAWWRVSDLAVVLWQGVASAAMESAGIFGVYSLLGSVSWSPTTLLGGFLMLSVGSVAAAWILYRNLIATHPADGRYAHASLS